VTPRSEARVTPVPIGGKTLSFESFMRSLAAERSIDQQTPTSTSVGGEASPRETELSAESSFLLEHASRRKLQGRGEGTAFDQLRYGGGTGSPRYGGGTGSPRYGGGTGSNSIVSDAEDELLLAEAPRPSPHPSSASSPRRHVRSLSPASRHQVIPDWVKSSVPSAPSVDSSADIRGAKRSPSSGRPLSERSSSPSLAYHGAIGKRSHTATPNDKKEVMYTNTFDDVFRIGFGGALPGTLAAKQLSHS